MRVDFNGNGFSASMDENEINTSTEKTFVEKNIPKAVIPILGCVSLFFSLSLIPFGFLAVTGAEICYNLFQFSYLNFISACIASLIIIVFFSSITAILSTVLYFKSERNKITTSGLIISVVSMVSILLGIIYNVFVLIAHFT